MPKIEMKIMGWICLRCDHAWRPREGFDENNKPVVCPKCKSPYWDTPKKEKKVSK